MKLKHYTIPIFIPELACPFQCVFCDQRKISGHSSIPSANEVKKIIETYLKSFIHKNAVVNIGFFGGNFTGISMNEQEEYLKTASVYLRNGDIHGIRLSTRPDYINEEVINLLANYSVSTVELGAQSFHDDVLLKSGRGHKAADISNAAVLIKKANIKLGLQMMIGLPGDSAEHSSYTASKIIEHGADNTRIYPTLIIKGTALERLYKAGKYSPLSLNEAVKQTKSVYLLFEKSNVNVIRVGLHPSEELLSGEELIAGPFHISFKELVLSSIWKDQLNNSVDEKSGKSITVKTSNEEINYAVGYQSSNKLMLKERFNKVLFAVDSTFTGRQFEIIYN